MHKSSTLAKCGTRRLQERSETGRSYPAKIACESAISPQCLSFPTAAKLDWQCGSTFTNQEGRSHSG
jgi:hypothetical protein